MPKTMAEMFTKFYKHEMEDIYLGVKFLGCGFKAEKRKYFSQ